MNLQNFIQIKEILMIGELKVSWEAKSQLLVPLSALQTWEESAGRWK